MLATSEPPGCTSVGGLALSQIVTLFTTPVVYLYLDRPNAFFRHGGDKRSNSGSDALRVCVNIVVLCDKVTMN